MRFEVLKFDERFARLLNLESLLVSQALKFGLKLRVSRPGILSHLITLPETSLSRIEENLTALRSVWLICETEQIDPWDDREFLSLSMRALNLNFAKNFLDQNTSEDLVEGYDSERFQIFRNMRFMETSAYSLLEIQSYPWPDLFSRDSKIADRLISYCDEVLWENNSTIALDISEHVICEIKTEDKNSVRINFRHLAPIYNGPNRPYGILISCKAEVVPETPSPIYLFPRA